MPTQLERNEREELAKEIAATSRHSADAFNALSAMLPLIGDPEQSEELQSQLLRVLTLMHLETTGLIRVLTVLVGEDEVEQARTTLTTAEDVPQDGPAHGGPDLLAALRAVTSNNPSLSAFRARPSRAVIAIDGATHYWATDRPLLGAAIEQVFQRHLDAGETLYLGDALTKNGQDRIDYRVVEIPPTAQIEWHHDATDHAALATAAAQVEDHVQRFGGVLLDQEGNLVEQNPHTR